jgi:hypothetical protein
MIKLGLRRAVDKFEREWNYDGSYIRDVIHASPRAARLLSRVTTLLAAGVVVGFGLAAPVAAHASIQPTAAGLYTMTPGRIAASTAAVLGLIGAVTGGLALARSAGRIGTGIGTARRGAVVALVLGPIGMVIGALVVATADGGLGTGSGLGGGVVAITVGLIGIVLGGLALANSRRAG